MCVGVAVGVLLAVGVPAGVLVAVGVLVGVPPITNVSSNEPSSRLRTSSRCPATSAGVSGKWGAEMKSAKPSHKWSGIGCKVVTPRVAPVSISMTSICVPGSPVTMTLVVPAIAGPSNLVGQIDTVAVGVFSGVDVFVGVNDGPIVGVSVGVGDGVGEGVTPAVGGGGTTGGRP